MIGWPKKDGVIKTSQFVLTVKQHAFQFTQTMFCSLALNVKSNLQFVLELFLKTADFRFLNGLFQFTFSLHLKKGISSIQLAKYIGVTQKTAWFVLHRIREVMNNGGSPFDGISEVDECYLVE